MADVKISELPVASTVNANDILVMNQGGATKTATQALIVAGLASTAQVAAITPDSIGALSTSAAPGFATTSQIASITPASIGALATSDASSFATTAQLNSITPASIGAIPTTQQSSFATTSQISEFTNTAQVAAISSAQIAAITPASIGAIATSQQSSFATTSQIVGLTNSAQVAAISSAQIAAITPASIGAIPTTAQSSFATTSQLQGYATTQQISGFVNSAQVQSLTSAQIAAITPASIGAIATSQQPSFATTSQISAFTTSSQVAAISSAQIAGITPASIGAEPAITTLATSKGGTGQSTYADGELLIGNSTGNTLTKATLIPGANVTITNGPGTITINASGGGGGGGGTVTSVTAGAGLSGGTIVNAGTISLATLSPNPSGTFGSTSQIPSLTVNQYGQVTGITTQALPAFATTAQVAAITPASIGAIATSQQPSFATTSQISAFTTTSQVSAISAAQIAAITPASIGAVSTAAVPGFATTAQVAAITAASLGAVSTATLPSLATTAQVAAITPASIGAIATSQQASFATTSQIATLTNTAQVVALTTQQLSAISISAGTGLTGGGPLSANSTLAIAALSPNPAGTYGSSTQVARLNVNQFGQVTGATNQLISLTTAQITGLAPSAILDTTNASNITSGTLSSAQLPASGVVFGTYGSGGAVPVLTIDQYGRATSITTAATVSSVSGGTTGLTPATATTGAVTLGGTLGISNGGTGATSAQQAINALAGSATSGQFLRGNGTDVVMSAIQTSDVPVLNQNTTGTAANVTGTVAIANGGTGSTTQQTALNAIAGAVTSGQYLRGNGTNVTLSSIQAADVPTLNQNTTGTASNVTGIVAIANGGTGAANSTAALAALGGLSTTASVGGDLSGNLPNPTVAKIQGYSVAATAPANGQVLTWNGSAWVPSTASSGGSGGGGVLFYMNNGINPDAPAPSGSKELGRTAEVTQTSITSGTLTTGVWTDIAGFVSDTLDPNLEFLPAGIFDFNVWARSSANVNAPTSLRCLVYTWNGTTSTLIATSGVAICSNNGTTVQTAISMVIPQTDITSADRLYIVVQANASASGHNVTLDFGGTTPSHVHTTIPSVGGTGVIKVINGVPQNPASKIVDSDISTAALISLSKIQMSQVSINTIDGLTGGGDLSASRTLSLTTTGISAGSFGSSAQIPAFTVDSYGRLTSATNIPFTSQPALTTANPLAISSGGTGAITGDDAISNLGFPNQIRSVAARLNLGSGTVVGQVYTVTANGALPNLDGVTLAVGDLVVAVQGSSGSQNFGFWVISNLGSASTQAVLTRPSWFQNGTTWNNGYIAFVVARSTFTQGNIFAFVATSGGITNITIGTTALTVNSLYNRIGNASLASNTFTNTQTFSAGSTSNAPARFQAGSLLTTVTSHSIEWDGAQMYVTNASTERLPVATSKILINAQTGVSYTLAATDAGYLVTASNSAAIALTVPTDATVLPVGTQVLIMQLAAGQVTVAGASGVTVNGRNGLKTNGQYAVISLIKIASNSWVVSGDATT